MGGGEGEVGGRVKTCLRTRKHTFNLSPVANSVAPDKKPIDLNLRCLPVCVYVNLYQQSGSSNLIGWQSEMGVAF